MTKKELMQLRYLNKEIELLKQQIDKLEHEMETVVVSDTVIGSNPEFPYQKRTFKIEGVGIGYYEKQLKRLRNKLRRRMEELMETRGELEEYIATIPDSLIRQILTLRYINGLSWQQVAAHIGGGNTADSVRMMHNRFLKGGEKFDKSDKEENA